MRSNFTINTPANRKNKRKLVFVVLTILVLIVGGGGYAYYNYRHTRQLQTEQKARDESQIDSAKQNSANTIKPPAAEADTSSESVKESVPEAEATVSIISAQQSGNMVEANAKLSSGDGSCVFTYTTADNDKPVIDKKASVNSACSSSLSANQFSRIGAYNLNVTVYINGKKAEANQSVTIN